MRRALQLAGMGEGYTAPNPMVGCVIVHNDTIIGEGWHRVYGGPHAEVNAVNSVQDKSLLSSSTMYVTLEPCSHYGKTPPCAFLITSMHIPRVVVSTIDINAKVSGRGIDILMQAGVEVEVGMLEQQSRHLNRRFFTYHAHHRPYIILKWAQTQDGYMDINAKNAESRVPYWITNDRLRYRVHQWRAQEAAIFCGANTIMNDNPRLNVRYVHGKQPVRLTYVRQAINEDRHFFDGSMPSQVFASQPCVSSRNVNTYMVNDSTWIQDMLQCLYEQHIQSVLVEGGADTLRAFLQADMWDEARVLEGDVCYGKGLAAPKIDMPPHHTEMADTNKILYYYHG